jgi:hypothetical protein
VMSHSWMLRDATLKDATGIERPCVKHFGSDFDKAPSLLRGSVWVWVRSAHFWDVPPCKLVKVCGDI